MSNQSPTFIRYFIQHRTAANLIMIALLIIGFISANQIRKQFFPDTINQSLNISVIWDGAGAKDIDFAINAPLLNALDSLDGIDSAKATAREGLGNIHLTFEDGWNMQQAITDAQAQIDTVDLPEDAETAEVRISAWRDRVADIVLSGPVRIELLVQYADELVDLLGQDGISKVTLTGISNPEIRIDITPSKLSRYNLSIADFVNKVRAEISKTPSGTLENIGVRLIAGADQTTVRDISAIKIKDGHGRLLRLDEIADIYKPSLNNKLEYLVSGNTAVLIQVDRDSKGDTVEIQRQLENTVAQYQQSLPNTIRIDLTRTRADAINDRLSILLDNAVIGLSLVLLLLFLFLSARSAFWVAAGIPVALAGALGLMLALGITINMISLFALIICLGIIVDDAIVVAEHADALHKQGMRAADATANAVKRMFAPVLTASITTILAFSALTLVGGRFGRFIYDIPITVIMVVLASFVECFLILPAHLYHSLKRKPHKQQFFIDKLSSAFTTGFNKLRTQFERFIQHVITFRYPIVIAAFGLLLFTFGQFVNNRLGFVFFNAPERSVITANIAMKSGTKRDELRQQLAEMDDALNELSEEYAQTYGSNPVLFSMSTLGSNVGRGISSAATKSENELGGYSIELIDPDLRPYSAFDFLNEWQNRVNRLPSLEELSMRGHRSGPSGDAIDIQLLGFDINALKTASNRIKAILNSTSGVFAVEDNLNLDKPELILKVNERGEELGITTQQIANELRQQISRVEIKSFASGRRSTSINIGIAEDELNTDYLEDIEIKTADGNRIYLDDVVERHFEQGFSAISREEGNISVNISGEYDTEDEAGYNEVINMLTTSVLPTVSSEFGLRWQLKGLKEQEREFFDDSKTAFFVCVIAIFVVLAWVFSSFSRAMLIILMIPFGAIGMIWGHIIHSVPMSMLSIIGFIGMAGIIINDSIVLVTTIDHLAEDRPIKRAIKEGAASRLRAVLLTTLTTVFGLAPLLFETSRQAQFLLPTVITLAYGLAVGMFIVLIITPCLIAISSDIKKEMKATLYMMRHLRKRKRT